jgi:hypothetical protein
VILKGKILMKIFEENEIITVKRENFDEIDGKFWNNLSINKIPRTVTCLMEYFYSNKDFAGRISVNFNVSSYFTYEKKKLIYIGI